MTSHPDHPQRVEVILTPTRWFGYRVEVFKVTTIVGTPFEWEDPRSRRWRPTRGMAESSAARTSGRIQRAIEREDAAERTTTYATAQTSP